MQGLTHPFGQSLYLWFRLARIQLGKFTLLNPLVSKDCTALRALPHDMPRWCGMVSVLCTRLGLTCCAMIGCVLCMCARTDTFGLFAFGKDSCQYRLDISLFSPAISHRLLSAAQFLWGVGKNRLKVILWGQKEFLIAVSFVWGWQGKELECHVFQPSTSIPAAPCFLSVL